MCEIEWDQSKSKTAPTAYFLVPFTQSVNVVARDESVTVRQLEGSVSVQTGSGMYVRVYDDDCRGRIGPLAAVSQIFGDRYS